MEYRQLGSGGPKVSAVALGAWAIGGFMWGGTDDEAAVAGVRKALDLGVTSIDTAPAYGFGHSERVVAQAIAGRRGEVQLLTKFGLQWEGDEGTFAFETRDPAGKPVRIYRNARRARVIAECEESLKRLNTDHIDLYQQHWPDTSTPLEETFGAVAQLLKDGKIRAAGVCNYSIEQFEAARKIVPLVSVQPPYSMINRDIERDLLPYCIQNRIGVLVYSPLQRGLLTGKITMDYKFPPTDHRGANGFFKPENRRRVLEFLAKIAPIAEAHHATLAQVVIAWTIRRPGITTALVGMRNPAQAEENAQGGELQLTDAEVAQIDQLLEGVKLEA
jgi:aryl-alcohol dehydrogenase-like predicted oxidoreductase